MIAIIRNVGNIPETERESMEEIMIMNMIGTTQSKRFETSENLPIF